MDTSLQGHTAIISGASMGLGLATAQAFCTAGAKVAMLARRADPLEAAVNEVNTAGSGGEARGYVCDVASAADINTTFEQVENDLGPVDILVNNAGRSAALPFLEVSDDDWQADLDLKLFAAIRFTRLAWPHMQTNKWGRIINVLNTAAKAPGPNSAPTSVSRAAGMALTKVLAGEGAPHNILVNAMLIGSIKSDQIRRAHEARGGDESLEEFVAAAGARLPMGRMGEAEEVANLSLFLASEAASYITGCAINMDGGLSRVP